MALTKIKLGKLIQLSDKKNTDNYYSLNDVKGISIQKMFIETKADMEGVSLKPYLIVEPDDFAYVTVTSRNGEKITIAHNSTNNTYIISSSYVVFRITRPDLLNSDYLFMYFNRPEFDRFSRYNSWGSARETFSFEDLCDIELSLPPLEIQSKFVKIYKGLVENQLSYETGLEDLKLTCDAYIENLRRNMDVKEIGPFIEEVSNKNIAGKITKVQGVESSSAFVETKANLIGVDLSKYFIVQKGNFAYNPSRINIGSIAMYADEEPCVISPMYNIFKVKNEQILCSEYLMLWLTRSEFFRSTKFYAIGSVRDTFDLSAMKEVKIPFPNIDIQKAIAEMYKAYILRKEINDKLKLQIKEICPILIKGSIEEARKVEF